MTDMKNLAAIDLNLLTVFDAVMSTRSTTRAASILGLTQPAVSHALARLRLLLADPLLVRVPGGMAPTPLAEEVAPAIQAVLAGAAAVFGREVGFDPLTSDRAFVLGMSDYAAFVILPSSSAGCDG